MVQEKENFERDCTREHHRDEQGFKKRIIVIAKTSRMNGKSPGSYCNHNKVE